MLLVALWAAGALVAVGVGLVAVRLVAGQVSDAGASALDRGAVTDALRSAQPTASRAPGPTATPTPTPRRTTTPRPPATVSTPASTGPIRTVNTRGGSVSARCVSGSPRLLLVTPAEGYRIEESSSSRVRFESSSSEVRIRLSCTSANRLLTSVRSESKGGDDGGSPTPSPSRSPEPEDSPSGELGDDGH